MPIRWEWVRDRERHWLIETSVHYFWDKVGILLCSFVHLSLVNGDSVDCRCCTVCLMRAPQLGSIGPGDINAIRYNNGIGPGLEEVTTTFCYATSSYTFDCRPYLACLAPPCVFGCRWQWILTGRTAYAGLEHKDGLVSVDSFSLRIRSTDNILLRRTSRIHKHKHAHNLHSQHRRACIISDMSNIHLDRQADAASL